MNVGLKTMVHFLLNIRFHKLAVMSYIAKDGGQVAMQNVNIATILPPSFAIYDITANS